MSPTAAAFGLRFDGLPATPWLAVRDAADWPRITCVEGAAPPGSRLPEIDLERATVAFPPGAGLAEIVHPLLGHVGLANALARGWDAVHAGAVLDAAGGAWAVVGEGTAGKSTLLAAASQAQIPVLSDDVLVIDGERVFAGPRCIDLRHPPAAVHGDAVRGRSRWRITQSVVPGSATLVGIVCLAWGDGPPRLDRLPGSALVTRLLERQHVDGYPARPDTAMRLLSVPAYTLTRARDLDGVGRTVDLLQALLRDGAAARGD